MIDFLVKKGVRREMKTEEVINILMCGYCKSCFNLKSEKGTIYRAYIGYMSGVYVCPKCYKEKVKEGK